jgi:hypothetical protein
MKRKYLVSVFFSAVSFFIIYTFLHEIGHGLIGVLAGGRIERLVIGFDARITISNASYNTFTLPLMNIMGMLLPYSIFLLISLFYNKNREDILYRVFHGLYIFGLSGSIIPWIFIPLMSFFAAPPAGDDVTKFLQNSGLNPVIVTCIGLFLLVLLLFTALKKGIINNFINLVKEVRNSGNDQNE